MINFQKTTLKMLGTDENVKDQVIDLMRETREARRSCLAETFSTSTTIKRVLKDYPKIMEFQGLLVC